MLGTYISSATGQLVRCVKEGLTQEETKKNLAQSVVAAGSLTYRHEGGKERTHNSYSRPFNCSDCAANKTFSSSRTNSFFKQAIGRAISNQIVLRTLHERNLS